MAVHPEETERTAPSPPSSLERMIEDFRVCWEARPEYAIVNGARLQIGFAIELAGTDERGVARTLPGGAECQSVFAALHEIASAVLPRDERSSVHLVSSFDQAIHFSSRRGNRPEVVLTITVLHRGVVERAVEQCQVRCTNDMVQRLRALGACEGAWHVRKNGAP